MNRHLLERAGGALAALLIAFTCTSLAGCGGGDGTAAAAITTEKRCDATQPPDQRPADCGTAFVELTDADGDFLSYTVDVVSLTLVRADGTTVETLPERTRIDLANYVDLTELLTASSVPQGVYTGGTLRLDYSSAVLEVSSGGSAVPAVAVDGSGAAVGTVDVALRFGGSDRLVVSPGHPARLTLDFDLAASDSVDLSTSPATVTVRPTLVASLERDMSDRPFRIRGPLISVDTAASTYTIAVRPGRLSHGHFGRLTVHTDTETAFDIDGSTASGAAGLTALAGEPDGTATTAEGSWDASAHAYVATEVDAGSAVPGASLDALQGTVVARSGTMVTVRGATLLRVGGSVEFDDSTTATLASGVVVRRSGETAVLGGDAVSVGQRVLILGHATSVSGGSFDALAVRLLPTHLTARVVGVVGGTLVADVASFDGRAISAFDFTGTGTTSATDADPSAYEIDLNGLSTTGIAADDVVRVMGFVAAYGASPPDFSAHTVARYDDADETQLGIGFGETGSSTAFSSISASALVVDLANPDIGDLHALREGPLVTDLRSVASAVVIVPDAAADDDAFVLRSGGTVTTYSSFSDFVDALSLATASSARVEGVFGEGSWDASTSTFTASHLVVVMD